LSDQNINYVVTATDTASPVFDKVDKAIEKTTGSTKKHIDTTGRARITQMNFNRVVQDAPFGFIAIQNNIDPLVSSFMALRLETKSTGGAFKALLGSFAGPAGLISIISLVVSGITAYIMSTRTAKKETDGLEKSVKKLNDRWDISREANLRNQLYQLRQGLPAQQGNLDALKLGGSDFNTIMKIRVAKDDILDTNMKILMTENELREISEHRKKNEQEIAKLRRSEIPKHMGQDWTSMWARSRVPRGLKPLGTDFKKPEITSMSEAEFRNLTIVSNAFVDTFRQNFIGAWEDAFGRANSLFEQLWQNIAGGLMDAFSQSVSNSIFTFLAASIGLPIGRSVSGGGTQIVIENKLGEDTFERGVYKSYGGASQRYKKVYRG